MKAAPLLSLRSVCKVFESGGREVSALHDVSFDVADGEFVCIVGTSGCGKSTILSLIAGLSEPSDGRVILDGHEVDAPGADRGFVFQRDTLFPWLSVEANVRFGLSLAANREGGADNAGARVAALIEEVGLADFAGALPDQLSGGMRQRAAIARALVLQPRLLLMDEPFGALDAQTREEMQAMLLGLAAAEGTTVLFVTHDVEEAVLLGDRIVVMHAHPGRVVDTVPIPLPRPRDVAMKLTAEFAGLRGSVLARLHA